MREGNRTETQVNAMFKILIADDEAITRAGIVQALPWADMCIGEVLQADDGVKALELVREHRPDILLSDIRMPELNGIELAKLAQAVHPDCKMILMSGYTDREYLKSAISLQVVDYVDKPIVREELERACRAAVDRCEREVERRAFGKLSEQAIHLSLSVVNGDAALRLLKPAENAELLNGWLSFGLLSPRVREGGRTVLLQLAPAGDNFDGQRAIAGDNLVKELDRRFRAENIELVIGVKNEELLVLQLFGAAVQEEPIRRIVRASCMQPDAPRYLCATGVQVDNLDAFGSSYVSATVALQRLFFQGYGRHLADTGGVRPVYSASETERQAFAEAVGNRNWPKANNAVVRLAQEIKGCDGTLVNEIKSVFHKWALCLLRHAEASGVYSAEEIREKGKELWDELLATRTLPETEQWLLTKLKEIRESLERFEHDRNALSRIYQCINQTYNDPELSVKQIADYAYLSPAYMCTYFKQKTGKTINHYMTEYRMQKAKEILADSRHNISEIAILTGYRDSNYFSKLFRKSTGLSPSEFRERVIGS